MLWKPLLLTPHEKFTKIFKQFNLKLNTTLSLTHKIAKPKAEKRAAAVSTAAMCGIALIVSVMGGGTAPRPAQPDKVIVSVYDIESALRRRGPDSLGRKTLTIPLQHDESCLQVSEEETSVELLFIGATLQLRGLNPVLQPFVDSYGNILVYNGEIFGGIEVGSDGNDGEVLMETLGNCGEGNGSIPDVLSKIKGPWAIIYWQNSSRTLWFGRDAFGRRSLLVCWPTMKDSQFLLSSVSPFSSVDQSSGILYSVETENGNRLNSLEELSCGIYSLSMDAPKLDGRLFGEVRKHEWANKMLVELIECERGSVKPDPEELRVSHCRPDQGTPTLQAQNVLTALRKSMVLRSSLQIVRCNNRDEELAPVAVLFSGGLDSMILAALLDECLDPSYGIDLLNVSFDGLSAPDRISARAGVKELMKIAASRRWKLVEIDAEMSKLTSEIKHVRSLISPANTYMDLNIGCALWLAACGDGVVYKGTGHNNEVNPQPSRYRSKARILLVGSGADEQCAGYGRHRTKYRSGSWLGLHEEMKLDMQRIWKRNMGRDDRCIADNGKEARFPFLDEDVIRTLLDIPLWKVANLDQPSGKGDKKILREIAQMLGLYEAAILPKRAIQFGSRIARESNRKNFGSNRAANQASAGSAVIDL